jgi:Flp pilus assembly protein TadG
MIRLRLSPKAALRDSRGTSVIELGLISPVLLIFMLGMIDLSMGYSAKLKLQQSAARAIELANAGGISSPAINAMSAEAQAASGLDSSHVTVDSWLECDGTRQTSIAVVCADGQQVARYVSVTINSTYAPMMSGAMQAFGLPGTVAIRGDASVRMQ